MSFFTAYAYNAGMISPLVAFVDLLVMVGLAIGTILSSYVYGPTELGPDNFDGVITYDVSETDGPATPEQLAEIKASQWGYIEGPHHIGFSFDTNKAGQTVLKLDGYCGESSGVVNFDGATMMPVKPLKPDNIGCGDSQRAIANNNEYYEVFNNSPTLYTGSDSSGNLKVYVGNQDGVLHFIDPTTVRKWPTDASSWASLFTESVSSQSSQQSSGSS